jgi:hypothetical protein
MDRPRRPGMATERGARVEDASRAHRGGFAPDMPPVPIDDVLGALQILANRHRRADHPDGPAPPSPLDADPAHRRTAPTPHAGRTGHEAPTSPADVTSGAEWGDTTNDVPVRRGPGWGSTILIVVSAAILAVLLVGALSLTRQMFHREPAASEKDTAAASTAPGLVRMPNGEGTVDLPTIEKAMNDCDADAARNPDALDFVILPLLSPIRNYQPWIAASVGDIGTSVILLRSKDALDGLRDGSLTLYDGPYMFSIVDAATEVAHTWDRAHGVTRLDKRDAAQIASFRVRFGFADFVGDTPSNFRFPRQKGVCYWVSALLRQ